MTRISQAVLATALAAAASGVALADDGGGDNGMNPFYGDSWAWLQGQGRNTSGEMVMPGAYSVVPPLSTMNTSLAERMRQSQENARAFSERVRQQTIAAWRRTTSAFSPNPAAPQGTAPARSAPPPNTFENDTGG
jgi:hypothetical protein